MTVTKNITNSSVTLQWDAVDHFFNAQYIVAWGIANRKGNTGQIKIQQTNYTITGLTLNRIYIITVTPANICGRGPKFTTDISLSTDNTFVISPNVPTNSITSTVSNANPSSNTIITTANTATTATATTPTAVATTATTTTTTTDNIIVPTSTTSGMFFMHIVIIIINKISSVVDK